MLRERARGGGDDDELERRPADVLCDVERRGQVGAAAAERRAQEHHPGYARVGADERRDGEERVPDERADEDGEKRIAQRECRHEQRADDDDEQRHGEVAPQQGGVEAAQHAKPLGDGLDAPARSPLVHAG